MNTSRSATSSSSPVETGLQNAVDIWKSVQWSHLLASVASSVESHRQGREQSLTARKALAETTKQFKKSVKAAESAVMASSEEGSTIRNTMEALSKECRVTVKAFQEETDNLTRRCKNAENAYASLFAMLQELPDPATFLMEAQHELKVQQDILFETCQKVSTELEEANQKNEEYKKQIQQLQQENQAGGDNTGNASSSALTNEEREELISLRKEVAEYEVEFRSLKNQDITIRKLEDKIYELQTAGAESLQKSIAQAREELAISEGRKVAAALEREATLLAKIESLQVQLRSERAGKQATATSLLEADEGLSRREAAWEAQRQILVDDNEQLRESLRLVTRERDEQALKIQALSSHSNKEMAPPSGGFTKQDLVLERNAYEAEVAELSATNSLLREEIRSKELQFSSEKQELQSKIEGLEQEIAALNSNLTSLEAQVATAPSQALVESMKRELRILKRLEYNADDVDTELDPEIAGGSNADEKDLESVLVAKLRKAESDLVMERNSKSDLLSTIESLKGALSASEKSKQEAEKLVASLEKDLERAIAAQTAEHSNKNASHVPVVIQENPDMLQHVLDPSIPAPSNVSTITAPAMPTTENAMDDHSVATIVMAQRDRLRARCEALEAERDSFKRELQGQVLAAETLKADNTKLYEKVRYLQSYNAGGMNAGAGNAAYRRNVGMLDRDLDLEALEQRYEASVDPFKQFSKAERARKLGEMSPMERTVFVIAKTVLSTKEMRTGLFFYMLALHLLVFITTYHWSSSSSCNHHYFDHDELSHLPPVSPSRMQKEMMKADRDGST